MFNKIKLALLALTLTLATTSSSNACPLGEQEEGTTNARQSGFHHTITDEGFKLLSEKATTTSQSSFRGEELPMDVWKLVFSYMTMPEDIGSLMLTGKRFQNVEECITTLNLAFNNTITDKSVSTLPNLEVLSLESNKIINDKSVSKLTNLEVLDLKLNNKITDEALLQLHSLKALNLMLNTKITDEALLQLHSLKALNLMLNNKITDNARRILKERGVKIIS